MTPTNSSEAEGPFTEWLLRAIAVICFSAFITQFIGAWLRDTSRWTLLLLVLSEGLTLALILFARRATARDMSPMAVIASVYSLLFLAVLSVDGTRKWAPEAVGMSLLLVGFFWQLWSKAVIGRSFGVLPARRRLVMSGPYRVVRHPIYMGYLIGHIAFLLVNWSWRNVAVIAMLYVAQIYRIRCEEAVLALDEEYREYQSRVRWRLIPGVY